MRRFVTALLAAAVQFNHKNGWVLSSHIAMSMMLALFPFALFTVSLAGAIAEVSAQSIDIEHVMELLFGSWPDAVASPIKHEVMAVLETSGLKLVTFSGVLTIYFASNGVDAVRLAMVSAYHEDDTRPFWIARAICVALVIIGAAGLLIAAVFEVVLPLVIYYLADHLPGMSAEFVSTWANGSNGMLVLCVPVISVFVCHFALPDRLHSLREIGAGALFTVILWWGAGIGFAYYIASFAQYSATYAGLAGAMVALVFLYLNAAILILGAELNGALMDRNIKSTAD
ncbi:YihY/virulence factor BrkB family protein [Tritonibacter litoralis]|nr:YihY/virulence factor BrkB family protein [Tritonibacter litoralis]